MTERERAERIVAAAIKVVKRIARPGQEITITHWWGSPGSDPQCITAREVA